MGAAGRPAGPGPTALADPPRDDARVAVRRTSMAAAAHGGVDAGPARLGHQEGSPRGKDRRLRRNPPDTGEGDAPDSGDDVRDRGLQQPRHERAGWEAAARVPAPREGLS